MMDLAECRPGTMVAREVWARTRRGVICRYVIWRRISDLRAEVLPIIPAREPAHRGDVPIDLLCDLVGMGLPGGSWVISTGEEQQLQPAAHIGTVPDDVWSMIVDARRRDGDSRRIEGAANLAGGRQTLRPVNLARD